MNEGLNNVYAWLYCNDLCVNMEKSKYMLIGPNAKIKELGSNFNLGVSHGIMVSRVSEIKYLGIVLESFELQKVGKGVAGVSSRYKFNKIQ